MTSKVKLTFSLLIVLSTALPAVSQDSIPKESDWANVLFAKNVAYGEFACERPNKTLVNEFFVQNPLRRPWQLSVCHNNCAVLKTIPNGPILPLDRKILGDEVVHIHVLANTDGKVIYARPLNGHPAVSAVLRKRACKATFNTADTFRQRVLSFCPTSSCRPTTPVR